VIVAEAVVPSYPVNLVVDGRPCLVVGGGRVAARKVAGLRESGARVHVLAPSVDAALKDNPGVTWEERAYRTGDAAGYRLVIAATDDRAVNGDVAADAERQGVWVNSADDPERCSFTLPSVVRRGALMVSVSTSGRSPAVARWLRERLDEEIGPEYAVLLDLVASERDAMKAVGRSTEDVDWRAALDSDMLDLIRSGQLTRARERLQACLSSSSA
jgi:precorrin-2 dehydrogenase / sirohydrochlorin ferrochelatase